MCLYVHVYVMLKRFKCIFFSVVRYIYIFVSDYTKGREKFVVRREHANYSHISKKGFCIKNIYYSEETTTAITI